MKTIFDLETIKTKVRKLLALSRNDNENEAGHASAPRLPGLGGAAQGELF